MDLIINFALFRNILSNSRVALKLALTKKKAASIEKCAAGELGWRLILAAAQFYYQSNGDNKARTYIDKALFEC
jgi:hypothetical protein